MAFWVLLAVLSGLACSSQSPGTTQTPVGQDPLNSAYVVDGAVFTLRDGRAEMAAAPGSATRSRLQVSGQPVFADLNGDGAHDAAVALIYDPGGSGTFFYVAAAVRTALGYSGTNAVRVGDRISPIDLRVEGRTIVYTYADRRPQEGFAVRPSVVRSKRLVLNGGTLRELP
ncbi:MAG TPA: hypothetical protein VLG10_02125 [Methylomirabilota bacterium]|nr:hypothetical protein [Methylomirabilota bacterium]